MSSDNKRSISRENVAEHWAEMDRKPKEQRILEAAGRQRTRDLVLEVAKEQLRKELGGDHEKIAAFATLTKDTLEHIAEFFQERKVSHGNGLVVLEGIIHTVANKRAEEAKTADRLLRTQVATSAVQ